MGKFQKVLTAMAAVLLLTASWPVCIAAEGKEAVPSLRMAAYDLQAAAYTERTVTYEVDGYLFKEQVPAGSTPSQVPALPEGFTGWGDQNGKAVDPAQTQIWENTIFSALRNGTLILSPEGSASSDGISSQGSAALVNASGVHAPFMEAAADGLFYPYTTVTRAEAAKIVYSLFETPPQEAASYPDLPAGVWYTQPMSALGAMGLLLPAGSGAIRPADPVTRAEFAKMLSYFLPKSQTGPSFSDVPVLHWAYESITAVTARGVFSGYSDGTFRPDGKLSRAETAVVVGRLLGRTADLSALTAASENVCIIPDVPADFWAYGAIMEAVVPHSGSQAAGGRETWTQTGPYRTSLPDGHHTINGGLYRVVDGMFLRSASVDGYTYDATGRYTTGSATLDSQLKAIISAQTNDSMTRDEKLKALYVYLRDNYKYLKKDLVAKEDVGWEPAYAEEFLNTARGNCFSYSAAFCLLARQMGLPAYTVVGKLGTRNVQDHGWVEIPLDGKTYMFDVELEWSYLYKHGQRRNLFKMDPNNAPFVYIR